MVNIRKLESDLWESADLLRAGSKLTSNQYCMPVLGLIFLRYAYSRFKLVEKEILKNRPVRGGRVLPVEASDFVSKSALFLPREAQYEYLVNLPADIASAELTNQSGHTMNSLGEVVNNAMELVEAQSEQLTGVLPKDYTIFSDELLAELLRIFNNSALDEVGGDVIGRIYEYFLNKFAKNIAQDDGVFFTPKSLVKMIVNILEPQGGMLLDPACGSGGNSTPYVYFIYCFLKSSKSKLDSLQKGSAQPHVYAKDINELTLLIPEDKYMEMFVGTVTPFFAKVQKLEKQIKLAAEARDRLLPKLMSGEIEV